MSRRKQSPSESVTTPPPIAMSRSELLLLFGVLVFGAALRWAYPHRMAVEHFDEGVYASNVWFDATSDHRYPMQHLYAPPLLPGLVEWAVLLFGPNAPMPMAVNLIAGCATIVLMWLMGRRWFGPAAGMTAATLCAFSDVDVIYSRTVLTDPLLCLWLSAAVFCIGEAHRRRDLRWAILGGALTGLAWWTKYNGWLPLAIQLSGVAGWIIGGKGSRRDIRKHLAVIAVTVLVAAATIAPMFLGLRAYGGYEVVAANHRGYLVGFAGWWDTLQQQTAAHRFLEGTPSLIAVGFAVLCGAASSLMWQNRSSTWNGESSSTLSTGRFWLVSFSAAVLLTGFAAVAGSSLLLGGLALAGFAVSVFRSNSENDSPENRLPVWLVMAWFIGLTVATPLYRAYPRLTLPWLIASWLGAGLLVETILHRIRTMGGGAGRKVRRWLLPVAIAGLVAGIGLLTLQRDRITTPSVPGWQDRRGFQAIADFIEKRGSEQATEFPGENASEVHQISIPGEPRFIVFVYGEPGLFYELADHRDGNSAFHVLPIASLDFRLFEQAKSKLPTFLVTGPHALRDESFREEWRKHASRFTPVTPPLRYRASDLVLLNEFPANRLSDPSRRPELFVRMYRVR